MKYQLSFDTLMRISETGEWILFNHRTKKHIQLSPSAYEALLSLAAGADEKTWIHALTQAPITDRSQNFIAHGLLSDPTGMGPATESNLQGEAAFDLLKRYRLIMQEGGQDYIEYLKPQSSILDQNHLGTFHQAIGKFQMSHLRTTEKWKWWHDQKFTPDGRSVKPGLYSWVQEAFFNDFFKHMKLVKAQVLDYGCGNGYYSAKFAELGAEVQGLDTSQDLIELAKKNFPQVKFHSPSSIEECFQVLRSFKPQSFDLIYMSDVLLFFFYDPKTHKRQDEALKNLLVEFRRLLKPEGRLYLMEPNGFFWLMPWYGSRERPYTILTEGREKLWNVSPTADQVTQALSNSGFALRRLIYPGIHASAEQQDQKTYGFAKEFPLWDFYEAIGI